MKMKFGYGATKPLWYFSSN